MTWTILVLILGIALYVFNGNLVKQDAKRPSAMSVYLFVLGLLIYKDA